MKFINGIDRNQIQFFAYEERIAADNDVRLIDAFVNALDLAQCGFDLNFIENGRPAYHPKDLLKLYIYGYLNRIRSSRTLEKECKRNIELIWLINGLAPDHNTIANFRKDNPDAIRNVFKMTVKIAQHFELIGGKLIAGDGTRLRAQNAKKNNYNEKKIERHVAYIEQKLDEYNTLLASQDGDKLPEVNKKQIEEKISQHHIHKNKYQNLKQQLKDSGDTQISTSDPESRQIMVRNNIAEVCYNIQSTVDAKHNMPIDYKVTNTNDSKAMGDMLQRAKEIIGHNNFTALYDKGYHTGSEIEQAEQLGIKVLVAVPEVAAHAPDTNYDVAHFVYDKKQDTYTCPQGQILRTNGKWYNKERTASTIKVKHYKTTKCLSCPAFAQCTKNKKGRFIERSQHQDAIDRNTQRVAAQPQTYKQRQGIVEHPFGTIKRQWGFDYIITKITMQRASADIGLIFSAYNLRRIINIIDKKVLQEWLRSLLVIFQQYILHFKPQGRVLKFTSENRPSKINSSIAA